MSGPSVRRVAAARLPEREKEGESAREGGGAGCEERSLYGCWRFRRRVR